MQPARRIVYAPLEERIAALERAQSVMRSEQVNTCLQIEERMSALLPQVTEQQRRLAAQGWGTDTLTRAVPQQFNTISTSLNARFDAQTAVIRAQFDDVNMAITTLSVTANSQGQDTKDQNWKCRQVCTIDRKCM